MPPKTDLLTIIPKPKIETPKWVNIAFLICLAVWVALIGFFVFFKVQASSQQNKKADIESQLAALNTKENQDLESKVAKFAKKIKNFSLVFKEHRNNFRFFDFLRNNCHPNVRFYSLNLTSSKGTVILDGQTDTYQSLSQQIAIFKKNSLISDFQVFNISLSKEGKITFQFSLKIDQQVLSIAEE
ncbi:MAG: hypothetical protein PHW31_00475 [Candidatus Pacebacteria bacterium]|nr:hypothetical protein [Candidatus Paceibacterota bacterium]